MFTAMITTSFSGLVRAVGMLVILSILADHINFILSAEASKEASEKPPINPIRFKMLFSGALNASKENSTCNPYRFKNVIELTAQALGFIFFIQPRRYRYAICAGHNFSPSGNRTSFSENHDSYTLQGNHHSSTLRRNVTARQYVHAEIAFQKPTTRL